MSGLPQREEHCVWVCVYVCACVCVCAYVYACVCVLVRAFVCLSEFDGDRVLQQKNI